MLILQNVFNYQSSSPDDCYLVGFANSCFGYSAALVTVQRLFCPSNILMVYRVKPLRLHLEVLFSQKYMYFL